MQHVKQKQGLLKERRKEAAWCYLMLAVPIIGFLVLTIYPILWTFRWSFFSYNGSEAQATYIGLRNFVSLFTTDTTYWKTWLTTLLFTVWKVPIELVLAMILALILNRGLKGSNFFRSVFYLPNVISVAIIGVVFSSLFLATGNINAILRKLNILQAGQYIDWFSKKSTAMFVVVIGSIWNTFGVNVMYFMAALTNVPQELYECADLDGATGIRKFFSITLPLMAPVAQIVLLLSVVGTLGINEYILVLTNGAPSGQTFTVMSYLTNQFVPGFASSSTPALGYGCAMSLITTILFLFVAIGYNALNKKLSNLY